MGLGVLKLFVEGDDSFIPFEEFVIGCEASADQYEELLWTHLHGIGFAPHIEGTDCGLKVVTYHIIPTDQRLKVERRIWDCFSQSAAIQEANNVSCAGRYTFFGNHVKWLPSQVSYTIVEGEDLRASFQSYIPWMQEKLKVEVAEAPSSDEANLFLHLGIDNPPNCPERLGCGLFQEEGEKTFGTIYISAGEEYFGQVLKHELLHVLLPMGHLPQGNYLMSIRPDDPSQTQTLTPDEEKLLQLYTHAYLRDAMTMEQFSRYLVIEG